MDKHAHLFSIPGTDTATPAKDMPLARLLESAYQAAEEATAAYKRQHGEGYPCGFAWVVIRPATSSLVRFMKLHKLGSKHVYGGWCVYNPSGAPIQDMYAKEAGAAAFAHMLSASGYDAHSETRWD